MASTTKNETGVGTARIDPYVARVLAHEPVESQRTVLGILIILKALGRAASSVDWPEFREYAYLKYPTELDEDIITVVENLIDLRRARRYSR